MGSIKSAWGGKKYKEENVEEEETLETLLELTRYTEVFMSREERNEENQGEWTHGREIHTLKRGNGQEGTNALFFFLRALLLPIDESSLQLNLSGNINISLKMHGDQITFLITLHSPLTSSAGIILYLLGLCVCVYMCVVLV